MTSRYKTKIYQYFSEHVPDIFSAAEEQCMPAGENGYTVSVTLDLFSQSELDDLYNSKRLLKSEIYSKFLTEEQTTIGVQEFDEWVNRPFLNSSKKKRYALTRTVLQCLKNVVQISTIIIPTLEDMEKIYQENGEEHLFILCKKLVDSYDVDGVLEPINEAEKHDLAQFMYEISIQYILGFELGLKKARGRFARKAKELWGIDIGYVDETSDVLPPQNETSFDISMFEKGINYENECRRILEDAGFETTMTKASGDQGADLICEMGGISFAIQCKNTARVGNRAVQEALASQKHYSTDFAVVVATGDFTKSAKDLASTTNVILVGTNKLRYIMTLAV